jgi:hypothetical protein
MQHSHDIEKSAGLAGEHGQGYNDPGKGYYGEDNNEPVDVEKAKAQFEPATCQIVGCELGGGRIVETTSVAIRRTELLPFRRRPARCCLPHNIPFQEDQFNLAEYIRGTSNARDEQGFNHKQIAVTWDHLRVIGGGGLKIHVRTFPNAIMEQFIMPVFSVLKMFGLDLMSPKPRDLLHDFSGSLRPGEMCLVLARPGVSSATECQIEDY